jgi:hypothetical protein
MSARAAPPVGLRAAILAVALALSPAVTRAGTLTPNAPPPPTAQAPATDDILAAMVAAPQRTPRFVARDAARHPLEELRFFGVFPSATVVEIWPGGGYWTEILAPYLREQGQYIAALPDETGSAAELAATHKEALALRVLLASDPGRYEPRSRAARFGGFRAHVSQFAQLDGPGHRR